MCCGGIPFGGFHKDIARSWSLIQQLRGPFIILLTLEVGTLAGRGEQEDPVEYLKRQNLFDQYWDDKVAHLERINVPIYVVAS